jgi:hypothetical protein
MFLLFFLINLGTSSRLGSNAIMLNRRVISCPLGEYPNPSNITNCIQCETRKTTTKDSVYCNMCELGFYKYNTKTFNATYSTFDCISCPYGAVCGGSGLPVSMPGYIATKDVNTFVQCSPANACNSMTSTYESAPTDGGNNPYCSAGYTGLTCGSCQPRYYRLNVDCLKCPDVNW